uniref:Uncharacterized protein n=1 Tax=Parascaris equorum TaxID=6256 RepID=A0A914REV9_PAREQ
MLSPSESTCAPISDGASRRHFGTTNEVTIGGMSAKPTSELSRDTYPTDRSEITDTKDKKKKHRKHRKDKRKEKSEREAHTSEGKHNKKRHVDETGMVFIFGCAIDGSSKLISELINEVYFKETARLHRRLEVMV